MLVFVFSRALHQRALDGARFTSTARFAFRIVVYVFRTIARVKRKGLKRLCFQHLEKMCEYYYASIDTGGAAERFIFRFPRTNVVLTRPIVKTVKRIERTLENDAARTRVW